MDLSLPLAVVTPTLDAAVLQALAASTTWTTGRQVHRLAGHGSADGVRRVLARLVAQGVVDAQEQSHATLYRLNRRHVASDGILALTRVRQTIIDRITGALAEWSPPPVHASLFGSFARNEGTMASDIDTLVVHEEEPQDEARAVLAGQLEADILVWTGNPGHVIDISVATLATMSAGNDPLVQSWREDHVHLMGARLLDVLRAAA